MAKLFLKAGNTHNGAPYGNVSVLRFDLQTNAKGILLSSKAVNPPKANDVIVLGELPEGFTLQSALTVVKTALTGVSGKLGFAYADGVDDPIIPQDDAYFGEVNLATVGRVPDKATKLIVLPKKAHLILTVSAGTAANAADVAVLVTGELVGQG